MNTHSRPLSVLLIILTLLISSCNSKGSGETATSSGTSGSPDASYFGNYVSENYSMRNEGLDWSVITISDLGEGKARIVLRSRADVMEPSCSFDHVAEAAGPDMYIARVDEAVIRFRFEADVLQVSAADESDEFALTKFCTYGHSMSGVYRHLLDDLDERQLKQGSHKNI